MKLYYLFLLIMFFLISCERRTNNVSETRIVGSTASMPIIERTVDGHDYINIIGEYTHSGTCRKCKQERDSIVSIIINTIKDGRDNN